MPAHNNIAICICTFKRPHLLEKLIIEISNQTRQPDILIVVDGEPDSGEVPQMLKNLIIDNRWKIYYIPSNHANLSYQRYLGWKTTKKLNCGALLYLDDDLRIRQTEAVEKTLAPLFGRDRNIVGVTGKITIGGTSHLPDSGILVDRASWSQNTPFLVRMLGDARKVPPGGLSPSGHRCQPVYQGQEYQVVQWLRGGVMAYKMEVLTEDCFSEDLFALDHIRCGLGEDTFLSRRVGARGILLLAFCANFEHPYEDLPKSYPTQAFKFGYASAYSRRFLNDNFRGFDPPRYSDRLALIKSYLGTCLLNWWRAFAAPKRHRFAFAWGYTLGAFRGLIQKPTAKNLTPHIDWWAEAEAALANRRIVSTRS